VTAEGEGPDPARGSHFHGVLLEEAARIPWSEQVHASVRSVCPDGRLYNSTPHGTGNAYGRLAKTRPTNFRFLRHHWSVHPVYSQGVHVAGSKPGSCKLCRGNERGDRWEASDPTCHRYPGKLTSPWYDRADPRHDRPAGRAGTRDRLRRRADRPRLPRIQQRDPRRRRDPVRPDAADHHRLGLRRRHHRGRRSSRRPQPRSCRSANSNWARRLPRQRRPALLDTLADLGVPLQELEPQFTREWLGVGDPPATAHRPPAGAAHYRLCQARLHDPVEDAQHRRDDPGDEARPARPAEGVPDQRRHLPGHDRALAREPVADRPRRQRQHRTRPSRRTTATTT
jgi:hypothetical protein